MISGEGLSLLINATSPLVGEGVIPGRTIARTRGTESIWPGANVELQVHVFLFSTVMYDSHFSHNK